MATKSFTTEFKFKSKNGYKLLQAIENSRPIDHSFNQKVTDIKDKEELDKILDSFVKE